MPVSERAKRGRPPKGPMSGKGSNFATRITAKMRAALDDEAEATGRSVSQIAELWLAEGLKTRDGLVGLPGAETIRTMIEFAKMVQADVGDPRRSLLARDALIEGWGMVVRSALTNTPDLREGAPYRAARAEFRDLCRSAMEQITEAADQDGIGIEAAYARPTSESLLAGAYGRSSLASLLLTAMDGVMDDQFILALRHQAAFVAEAVKETAPRFYKVVNRLLKAIDRVSDAKLAYMGPRRAAAERGRALVESMQPIEPIQA